MGRGGEVGGCEFLFEGRRDFELWFEECGLMISTHRKISYRNTCRST